MNNFEKSRHPGLQPVDDTILTRESWKIFQIMAEFVEGFERLARIKPSVSLFGSARTTPEHPHYQLAEEIAHQLSNAGFSIVSGGGPGIMEAVNKGAFRGKSPSIGLNIMLPQEQTANDYQDISLRFRHFFRAKSCSSNMPRPMWYSLAASEHSMKWRKYSPWSKPEGRAEYPSFW